MKSAKSITEQIDILENRGLLIDDYEYAQQVLQDINYYTLTGYLFLFLENGTYEEGTNFKLATDLYYFDSRIRNLLSSLISEAEEKLKTRIAYQVAMQHIDDPLIYTDINYFKSAKDHSFFMSSFQKTIQDNREVPFVKHHIHHYRGQFPIWVAVELFTLGNLKYFYKNIPIKDRKAVSRELNLSPKVLDSWIDTLRIIRNKVAHNMRLYGTTFQTTPKFEKHHLIKSSTNRLFMTFVLLHHLIGNSPVWKQHLNELDTLIQSYSETIKLEKIGFPSDWKEQLK